MLPPIANRFVAGETAAAAFDHTRSMNDDGIGVLLNLLGEHYGDPADVDTDMRAYRQLVRDVSRADLDACVSVKPSQIGLDVSEELFARNYRSLVAHAADHDVFVWCDMEDSDTTDVTLDTFVDVARDHPWTVGQCLQSNLKRTRADLERVVDVPGAIRIVKGAYDEPASIAYTEQSRVNEAYRDDIAFLFEHRDRGVAVGSHDPEMVSLARRLGEEHGTDYEIQMLMGVRTDAQHDLAAQGIDVRQYVPYGGKWLSYFYRRVRERKGNALFALRAILGR
ncbi:proline dehydrogenase family protein [Halopenitus sp. POP-27]|uniref:proline dehydrogenase family protein n=1 Tax=Halopenitus sp. POP-27 TaxID=2994425 RepID=UPI002468E8C3|nr:proline dehydrogenase family protein [Halopenitus sp. POP-27]